MPTYLFFCEKCKKTLEAVQSMNTEHRLEHCGQETRRIFTVFQTNKDLMYQFTTKAFGKPVDIHSRRQYKRLLKQHGCADATVKECLSVKPKNDMPQRAKKIAKEVTKEMYERGTLPWVMGKEESPRLEEKLRKRRGAHAVR